MENMKLSNKKCIFKSAGFYTFFFIWFLSFKIQAQNNRIDNLEEFSMELYLTKNYEKILKDVEPMIENNKSSNKINQIIGYSKIELNKFKEGIEWINEKVTNKIYMDDLYLGKGYLGIGSDSLALMYFEKAAPLDTNNNVYSLIHDVRYKQKRYADAAKAGLGSIDWKRKKNQTVGSGDFFKVAMDYYLTSAYMDRSDTIVRPAMAMKADSMFAKAIEINDKWPPFYINRARANNFIDYTGTKWLGAPYYEKFLASIEQQKNEKNSTYKLDLNHTFEAFKYLGGYYNSKVKDTAKAKEYFLNALQIKPNDPDIKAALSN
ncbi:tetratricopeptide repeat protein [Aquirufa aurantiipilula]|uniref:hypothetical protein n=1 Tax=Aquirufa aurantiipilula TaxID=2696561 RepID=UPI001CAA53D4|nr:hypothetical protein [Aquirufa aurantiipilula]MBZ1327009.1 hypothetical protein [Aquirufa aurantiipilula]